MRGLRVCRSESGRRVAGAETSSSVHVMSPRLLNSGRCSLVGILILIHGGLKLFEELVDVQEVVFGSQIR